jgi:hypothetical protein
MQTIQLAMVDSEYAASLRAALVRSGPWHVESVRAVDPSEMCVLVIDEESLNRTPLPLSHPERVVLITHRDPETLENAWEAGIVSVVSSGDPLNTVLLAIMAAALRVPKPHLTSYLSGISPNQASSAASISPEFHLVGTKRCKTP